MNDYQFTQLQSKRRVPLWRKVAVAVVGAPLILLVLALVGLCLLLELWIFSSVDEIPHDASKEGAP